MQKEITMFEEKQAAQTTAEAGAVENAADGKETLNEKGFSDAGTEAGAKAASAEESPKTETKAEEEGGAGAPTGEAAKQSKEQNSENAKRRREAERKAEIEKAEKTARCAAIIDALDGKNPYTGEEMKDQTDVDEYLAMRQIKKNGGDPVMDYAKYQKNKERERAENAEKEASQRDWYQNDLESFEQKHPEANFGELANDPLFNTFAKGKVGILPLSEIYEGFLSLSAEYEKKAKEMAAQLVANSKASPGSLSASKQGNPEFFTKEQVNAMPEEDIQKNYDKIIESMKKWKN